MWYHSGQSSKGHGVDVTGAITHLEAVVSQQVSLAGHDPTVEAAAEAVLAALQPALRQAAINLAEQAAAEVNAQLPGQQVDVVLSDGEPVLTVRPVDDATAPFASEDLEARLTLRLPGTLKSLVEDAATQAGDSVNSYVIKTLSSRAAAMKSKPGRRFKGTVQT